VTGGKVKLNMDKNWLPDRTTNAEGDSRCVGVEVELAGVTPHVMARLIESLYGGEIIEQTRFEFEIKGTCYGDFKLELDSSYMKALAAEEAKQQAEPGPIGAITVDLFARASELLVPWEIVSPPIPTTELHHLCELIDKLREQGALGTRHAPHFAFGVHLNPDLPDLETTTIVNFLRAYFCLFDWISTQEEVDLARKITPYIDHFGKKYIKQVIDPNYNPSRQQLIDNYLDLNPTRNRSLDMLPLFAHLDEARVRKVIDDPRIKPRPTFHYRLPNCDIDNPQWNLDHCWFAWLEVESLSNDPERLQLFCAEYNDVIDRLIPQPTKKWCERTEQLLAR
jgi:hypothetical protein